MGWRINTIAGKPTYHQPLADDIVFYIKSNMKSGRFLFWNEDIGGNQFRLRINEFDIKVLKDNEKLHQKFRFVFDSRTRSIRAAADKKLAISNRAGQKFNIGHPAVVREWRNEVYQRIRVYGGSKRNIRNDGGKCLDVHGGRDTQNRRVIFWNCHNGANQGWTLVRIDFQVVVKYQRPPIADGVKFQIRSTMSKGRSVFVDSNNMGNEQYRLKIQDHAPWDERQWFTFDSRTQSIRQFYSRNMAISREFGTEKLVLRGAAVVRPWRSETAQKTFYNGDKQFQDFGNFVLTIDKHENAHGQPLVWFEKQKQASQKWRIDKRGVRIPAYPLKDDVKFQIRSRMKGGRALSWHEDIGGRQFRLRI